MNEGTLFPEAPLDPPVGEFGEPIGSYARHRDYLRRAKPAADDRQKLIRENALAAFQKHLTEESCVIINFRDNKVTGSL